MPLENPEIVSLGTDPINGTSPAGVSVRNDPTFDELTAEIAKTESMTATVIDWTLVQQLSTTILKTKSKDYRVASYLAYALLEAEGLQGLLSGLRMYEGMVRNFWDTAFPEKSRIRGRIGALRWLNDRLASALTRDKPRSGSDELVLEFEKAATEFVAIIRNKLAEEGAEEQSPGFAELLADAAARADELRARKAAAERAKEEEARRAEALASGEILAAEDADKVIDDCREKLSRVADFLYNANPADPLPYLIRRSITWGCLGTAPVHENRTTYIPPVPSEELQRCEGLAASGEWLSIIAQIETNLAERIFAFGLQRHCAVALENLGGEYSAAKVAVVSELAGLLRRMPELMDLKFNDGTPMVDAATRSWLQTEVLSSAGGASGTQSNGGAESGVVQEIEETTDEARRRLAGGNVQEALMLFQAGIARSPQRRLRFLWRLHLAKLCMESGKPQLALPQLMSLDEEVQRFCLEEWEPQLSLQVVQHLFLCRRQLSGDLMEKPPDVVQHLEQLYQRLCRLDVSAALGVEP